MHWTTTRPTRSGWYWVRFQGTLSGRLSRTVVHCYDQHVSHGPCVDTVFWDGDNVSIEDARFLQWSNEPLVPPEEPPDAAPHADALTLLRQLAAREPLDFTQTPRCVVCVRPLGLTRTSPRLGHAPDCPWLAAWTYCQAHPVCAPLDRDAHGDTAEESSHASTD